MPTQTIESIPICFAGVKKAGRVPVWARKFNASAATLNEFIQTRMQNGIVVIHSKDRGELEDHLQKVTATGKRFGQSTRVVIELPEKTKVETNDMVHILRRGHFRSGQVEFAWGATQLKQSLTEAAAKYLVDREEEEENRPDALAEAKEVIAATRPLLAPCSGRLSAKAVAEVFGVSLAKIGALVGRGRQTLNKTPDASAIQPLLQPFARVARLRAVLGDNDFRAWLERPNPHLDEKTPMAVIQGGRIGVVADLVEDMLTGRPS